SKARFPAGRGAAVVTPGGELIVAVSNYENRTWFHIRDAESGNLRGEVIAANALIRNLTLLPDGRTLVFVREPEFGGPTPPAILFGTVKDGFEAVDVQTKENAYTSLALHPSGKWLATGQLDGTVRIFDTSTWRETTAYQWPVKPVEGLAFAPNGLT